MILSRFWIGHTYITHSHLLKKEDSPPRIAQCVKYTCTVKYILINCDRFKQICRKLYQTNNLKDFLKNKPEKILSFLKETNLFFKI